MATAASRSGVSVFVLRGPCVDSPPPTPRPLVATDDAPTATDSISSAWNAFISPPPAPSAPQRAPRRIAIGKEALADAAVGVSFSYPDDARPPPRLPAFALPSWIDAGAGAQHGEVWAECCFTLTAGDGGQTHGCAVQLAEPTPSDANGAVRGRAIQLGALVILSRCPLLLLHRSLLRRIVSEREALWPADPHTGRALPANANRLRALLRRFTSTLLSSAAELCWLTDHPLWLPAPLASLFKPLRWEAAEAAYLLFALLTDQQVADPSAVYWRHRARPSADISTAAPPFRR